MLVVVGLCVICVVVCGNLVLVVAVAVVLRVRWKFYMVVVFVCSAVVIVCYFNC